MENYKEALEKELKKSAVLAKSLGLNEHYYWIRVCKIKNIV
jgi:hypothetical protein